MTRRAEKVGPTSWEPAEGTKPPFKLGVPDLDSSPFVQAGLKLIAAHSESEPATYRQKRHAAEQLRWRLLFLPGGGAHLLAAKAAQIETTIAGAVAENERRAEEGVGRAGKALLPLPDPCGSGSRRREWLALLPRDAHRDLDRERRTVRGEIQRLENRISVCGRNVPNELVELRMKLENRLAELSTTIDVRDDLRGPLDQLYREAIAGAFKGLATALHGLAEKQRVIIRKILFGNAQVYRLVASRIPADVEAAYDVILKAQDICNRLRCRGASWHQAFTGLDRELQTALSRKLGVRLDHFMPEGPGGVAEAEVEVDPLAEVDRQAMRA